MRNRAKDKTRTYFHSVDAILLRNIVNMETLGVWAKDLDDIALTNDSQSRGNMELVVYQHAIQSISSTNVHHQRSRIALMLASSQ